MFGSSHIVHILGRPLAYYTGSFLRNVSASLSGQPTWRGRGLSKWFISRVIIAVTPFRVLMTLLITYLLSPLPLQVVYTWAFKGPNQAKAH